MQEIWKPIKGYEGLYEVSNFGRVKSLERKQRVNIKNNNEITRKEKMLKLVIDKDGYARCMLYKNQKQKCKQVHRLVAQAYLNDYSDNLEVNHKDCNRQNNCVLNLEMCTRKQNMEYASRLNRMDGHKKRVLQYTKDFVFIKEFSSVTEAAYCVGTSIANICKALRNTEKTASGYKWRYADE